jgi:integrase
MAHVRAADKCPHSADSFVSYVENVYLPFVKAEKKPSTYSGYRDYFRRYLKPRTTHLVLRDFTMAVTSTLLADIASMHDVNRDTVMKCRSILSAIFTYALATGAFPGKSAADNPAAGALLPKAQVEKQETVAATPDEVRAILAHLNDQGLNLSRAAIALAAYLGCRPGEIRGLKWSDWDRSAEQIHIQRSVWRAVETTPKTKQSVRFLAIHPELRAILLDLWASQKRPIDGYILAREGGGRVNLDNESKRVILPAFSRCASCKKSKDEKHEGHAYTRDESLPEWQGWYSLRRFHGTQIEQQSGSTETMSKALGNSKAVADAHYSKPTEVRPDVRRAVNAALAGLSA